MDILYAIVLVGVLVFVHELGHFAWAKFFGVKVLTFSLGFGPKLLAFRAGETEYRVGVLPLGGYVRMLGESPLDVVSEQDRSRTLFAQPFFKKVIVVVAGPAMNLAFPLVLYTVVFLGDAGLPPAVIGTVFPDRPADGKLEPGDRIVSIDGTPVSTFYEINRQVESHPGEPLLFEIERAGAVARETIVPVVTEVRRELDLRSEVGRIGVAPHHPIAVVGVAVPGSPAAAAGMSTFDVVVSAQGRPIERWIDLKRVLDGNRGTLLPLTYLRPVRVDNALGGLVELDLYEPRVTALTPEPGREGGPVRAGLEPAEAYVAYVKFGSAEHRAGILPGDRLLELDGHPVRAWPTLLEDLRAGKDAAHRVRLRRGAEEFELPLRLTRTVGVSEHGEPFTRYDVGMSNWVPVRIDGPVPNPSPIAYAVTRAYHSTAELVELTVFTVVRLLEGRLTVKSIGGPISIFVVAGSAAREGALNYLALMAFISINLGLINLLPIPMLDGGHLLFFSIEAVTRRPIDARVRQAASVVGLIFLLSLMAIAIKNDIERQWPSLTTEVVP